MQILVLGGTKFAGRAIVEAALGRGDAVTLFNRGKTNPGLYPGVETVIGDRTEDLSPLDGREFDAVIDVACYDPAVARLSAEAFRDRAGRYVFVSSVSVYASQATTESQLEDAPLAELKPDLPDYPDNYGANKALSEAVVREVYGDRALIGRPGLITGPHDPTDRFPYWPRRIAAGGRVLAPGDAGDLTQVIDVRDLAAFLLDACHRDRGGVYNLTGAPRPFGILLDLCRTATYSDAELTWIPTPTLIDAGVDPGGGIPLWYAEEGYEAFCDVDSSHAVGAGPQLPVDHRDDPRHPLLGPGPRRPRDLGPVPGRGSPPAARADRRIDRTARGHATTEQGCATRLLAVIRLSAVASIIARRTARDDVLKRRAIIAGDGRRRPRFLLSSTVRRAAGRQGAQRVGRRRRSEADGGGDRGGRGRARRADVPSRS